MFVSDTFYYNCSSWIGRKAFWSAVSSGQSSTLLSWQPWHPASDWCNRNHVLVSMCTPSTSLMVALAESCCEPLLKLIACILWRSPAPTHSLRFFFAPCQHITFFVTLLCPVVLLELCSISANCYCPQGQSTSSPILDTAPFVCECVCPFSFFFSSSKTKTCPGKKKKCSHCTLPYTLPSSNSSAPC